MDILEKVFIDWLYSLVVGSGSKKRRLDAAKNKRLDLFLKDLEIEEVKRKQIVDHVEKLTLEALQQRSKPKLRLNKD